MDDTDVRLPVIGSETSPSAAMRLAIREAAKGWGRVAPNPLVGCAIVDRNHRLLAVGYHARLGGAHAEVDALAHVHDDKSLEGATVYVTLEPCAHQGRTGSCAKALSTLPLRSVVYAVQDPNPLVSGAGARILQDAGIAALALHACQDIPDRDVLCGEAEDLAEVFLFNMRRSRPFVSLKVASSLDGQMALATGESQWLTGSASRARVHLLRAGHDAVLIGRRTFEVDDPRLDVRTRGFEELTNIAVVLDPSGKSVVRLPSSRLARSHPAGKLLLIVGERTVGPDELSRVEDQGVTVIQIPLRAGGFSMPTI